MVLGNMCQSKILQEDPLAIYTHCYGYSLNLACQDTIRSVKVLKDALDTTFELSKLLKFSSKCKATLKTIKKQLAPSDPDFCTLCPTKWTVRAHSLASALANYHVLLASLESFVETSSRVIEMSAQVNGIRS